MATSDEKQQQERKKMIMWAIVILVLILLAIGGWMLYKREEGLGSPASPVSPAYRFEFY